METIPQSEPLLEPEACDKESGEMGNVFSRTSSLFYWCTLISSWDDRSWFFLVGIYLVALDPSNLVLTAIFGLLSSGLVLLLGSWVGSWVDTSPRLSATYTVLTIRNLSTLLCSVVLCLVFVYYDQVVLSGKHPTLLLLAKICLVLFGVTAHLGGMTNNAMLGKDWVAIFCAGDSDLLSKMTARFRLIDLVSKVVAPIIIGQIMTFTNKAVAAIFFSIQVFLSLLLFCFLLRVIYRRIPRLHYREKIPRRASYQSVGDENETEVVPILIKEDSSVSFVHRLWFIVEGWNVYFRQSVRFAGLGLAVLYMTVLGFDTVTIGFALSQGMSEFVLSLFNAGAAVSGMLGALVFPCIVKSTNIVYTGLLAILAQLLGLTPCLLSVWFPNHSVPFNNSWVVLINVTTSSSSDLPVYRPWSLYLLMGGIVASRVGLWMFDLTVSQLLIETVFEVHRGKVNGVQNSLNMLFDMVKFAMVLALPYPHQFSILIFVSIGAVAVGSIFYTIFAMKHKCKIETRL